MADVGSEPGNAQQAAEDAIAERAADLATEVTEADQPADRNRLAASIAAAARSGAAAARSGARVTGRGVRAARRGADSGRGRLSAQVVAMAQRLRVRDQVALRAQFPGLSTDEIADALIRRAARASAAVGGAVGAWAALPVLPAFPAEVVTETLALIGIEIKLVAELHEAYGMPATGSGTERMTAYVAAWAHRRGVFMVPGGLILAAGSPLARRLRWRLATRVGRSAFSLGPLLTGAVAGAMLNRQETRGSAIASTPTCAARPRPGSPGTVLLNDCGNGRGYRARPARAGRPGSPVLRAPSRRQDAKPPGRTKGQHRLSGRGGGSTGRKRSSHDRALSGPRPGPHHAWHPPPR